MLDMMCFFSNAALLSHITFDLPVVVRRDYNEFCCIVYFSEIAFTLQPIIYSRYLALIS